MADEHWWPLLKGSAIIYVGYGGTFTHLSATDFQMRKGPPVTIALDLNGNLRTRNKRSNMYIDAKALAAGDIRRLTRVELPSGGKFLSHLRRYLDHADDTSTPWNLIVNLEGEYRFTVEPEWREIDLVLLVSRLEEGGR